MSEVGSEGDARELRDRRDGPTMEHTPGNPVCTSRARVNRATLNNHRAQSPRVVAIATRLSLLWHLVARRVQVDELRDGAVVEGVLQVVRVDLLAAVRAAAADSLRAAAGGDRERKCLGSV